MTHPIRSIKVPKVSQVTKETDSQDLEKWHRTIKVAESGGMVFYVAHSLQKAN